MQQFLVHKKLQTQLVRDQKWLTNLAIMAKALKRDMEEALCQKGAKTTGNATTARVTGGFESWITSNDSRGTGGASTGMVLLQLTELKEH